MKNVAERKEKELVQMAARNTNNVFGYVVVKRAPLCLLIALFFFC